MKPHYYFWCLLFALLIWILKIIFFQILPFKWYETLIVSDFIFILISPFFFDAKELNKRAINEMVTLVFYIFCNSLLIILWIVEEFFKKYPMSKFIINVNNNIQRFNNWIDLKFIKKDK